MNLLAVGSRRAKAACRDHHRNYCIRTSLHVSRLLPVEAEHCIHSQSAARPSEAVSLLHKAKTAPKTAKELRNASAG